MQIPLRTRSSAEQYIARREWVTARLEQCPLHPLGGCGFARHGTYRRVTPFSDTVDGANASANLYTLVETAKANGIDPYRYLMWLFQRLPLAKTADDYDALLPWRMPVDLR